MHRDSFGFATNRSPNRLTKSNTKQGSIKSEERMDSFKASVASSTIFARRFNTARLFRRNSRSDSPFLQIGSGIRPRIERFCSSFTSHLKQTVFCLNRRSLLVRSNCFSFVCPIALLSFVHFAGQIFHRSFHRSAMKISFACRQFSLNPQTPLNRVRQLYIVL